jgi:hypothetical protein
MSKITWSTDVNAPGCPGEILADDGQSVLIQTDWDYWKVAEWFGWSPREVQTRDNRDNETPCDHDRTHGTVDCKECGLTHSDFISAAYDWLIDNDGAQAEDPGYFD